MADKINPYFLKKPDKYLLSAPTPLATKPTLRDTVKKMATTPTPPYLLDSPDKADSRKRSVMRDELNTRAAANIVNSNNPVSTLLAPNGWGDAKDTFSDSIDRQGGWGLSGDTRKLLGADDTQRDNSSVGNYLQNVKRPVQNLVVNAADAAFRAYQGLMAGTETAALGLDKGVDNAGLGNSTDKLTGNNHSFQPGHGALALMEAFPDGGLHTGIPAVNPREIAGYYAARRGDISMTPVVDGVSGSVIDHVPSDTVPPKADGGRQPYVVKPETVEAPQAAAESVPAPAAPEVPVPPEAAPAPSMAAPEMTPQSYADAAAEKGLGFINSPEAVDYYTKNAPAIAEELDRRVNNPNEGYTGIDRRVSAEDTAKGSDEEFTNPVNDAVNEATFRSTEGLKKRLAEKGVAPLDNKVVAFPENPAGLDRIDYLDHLMENETDPKKLDAYESEQDQLMREERARYDANRPYNDDYPETLEERAIRKEREYNDHVYGDDQRMYQRRNTKEYKAWKAEASTKESAYRGAVADSLKDVPNDELLRHVARNEGIGHPYAEEVRAEAERRGLNSRKPWETPTVKTDGVADATRSDTPAEHPDTPETPEGSDATDVASRMTEALNSARRVLPAHTEGIRATRSERIGYVAEVQNYTSGESGYHAELGQLKGEMPKQDFEGVRDQFSQPEIDTLFDAVKAHPQLSLFDQINGRTGLAKLLDGQLPTKGEIAIMARVFPPDFISAALKNRTRMQKFMEVAGNAINLPRSLMSSFDLSAPFRQGLFLVGRKEFWKSFSSMFKAFGSERAYQGIMDDIRTRPTYDLMQDSGLSLSNIDNFSALTDREEAFMSSWAEKIPVIGRGVRASDRAYTGFLNKVRADTFDTIVGLSRDQGINFRENPKALKDIARFVNAATGRGSLGKFEQAGPLLNGLFFSPRLIASRVQLLNPAFYATLSPVVRKEAIKALISTGALATTVLGLAAAGGMEVEPDPRSSDFGKIKTGNTRYDVLGGFGQYITLGARLATNQTKTLKGEVQTLGKKFGQPNRLDVVTKFGESKFSPVAGFVADYLRGKDYTGQPFDLRDEAPKLFIPLFLQDAAEVMKENGAMKGAAMSVPGVFGVGMNTYSQIPPPPASLKVDGVDVELNRDARNKYQQMVQSYLDVNLDTLKKSGDWDKYSKEEQTALTTQIIKDGKKQAKADLFETDTETNTKEEAKPEASPQPVVKPGEALFDGFPGLPQSVMRTEKGNEKVGGVPNSDHLRGDAVDFTPPPGMSMSQLEAAARRYFSGMYVLNEGNHVHVRIPGLHGPLYGKNGTVK